MIRAGKDKGTYTPEDEIMIHKKAHAIVNCYIDSAVSPRVQVCVCVCVCVVVGEGGGQCEGLSWQ